ncbi:hypothetical protein ACQBAU_14455 [Propionibacteriaceae bacterium Y2011]
MENLSVIVTVLALFGILVVGVLAVLPSLFDIQRGRSDQFGTGREPSSRLTTGRSYGHRRPV